MHPSLWLLRATAVTTLGYRTGSAESLDVLAFREEVDAAWSPAALGHCRKMARRWRAHPRGPGRHAILLLRKSRVTVDLRWTVSEVLELLSA
jgi:hypothetical protein